MKIAKTMLILFFILPMLIGCASKGDEHASVPDGTIVIDNWQVAFIASVQAGEGKLTFQGKEHEFNISGVGFGGFGVQTLVATGQVYNLKNIEDLAGSYAQARAGITVGLGFGGLALENDKGVVIKLNAKSKGLALAIGVDGATIAMK